MTTIATRRFMSAKARQAIEQKSLNELMATRRTPPSPRPPLLADAVEALVRDGDNQQIKLAVRFLATEWRSLMDSVRMADDDDDRTYFGEQLTEHINGVLHQLEATNDGLSRWEPGR